LNSQRASTYSPGKTEKTNKCGSSKVQSKGNSERASNPEKKTNKAQIEEGEKRAKNGRGFDIHRGVSGPGGKKCVGRHREKNAKRGIISGCREGTVKPFRGEGI